MLGVRDSSSKRASPKSSNFGSFPHTPGVISQEHEAPKKQKTAPPKSPPFFRLGDGGNYRIIEKLVIFRFPYLLGSVMYRHVKNRSLPSVGLQYIKYRGTSALNERTCLGPFAEETRRLTYNVQGGEKHSTT